MYNKFYNEKDNDYGEKRIDPYNRNKRYNNENESYKNSFNMNNDSSPIKISSSLLMNRNKERFQNENLTVHRVSPVHYQYRANFYENYSNTNNPNNAYNEGKNYNNEREGNFKRSLNNNNNYINTDYNNIPNNGNNNDQYQLRNNNNQRYRTPNHYNSERNNGNYNEMRRKNSDLNIEKNKYYLKDPCDYYKGEEIDDGYRHYNPEDNDYNGSRFGSYIYNYYLNAPMRSDKTEDWRYPPLYYYKPNYDSKRKIYTNYH